MLEEDMEINIQYLLRSPFIPEVELWDNSNEILVFILYRLRLRLSSKFNISNNKPL